MHRVRELLVSGAPALLAIALLGGVAPASDGDVVRDGIVHWSDEEVLVDEDLAVLDLDLAGPDGTVYRLYRAYFLREPDPAGFAYWLDRFRAGHPLAAISDDFARSTEFTRTYGALSDPQFVERVYRNVMGRTPDAGGFAHWTRQMRAGMRRGDVMIAFSDSAEFRSKTRAPATLPIPPAAPRPADPDDPNAYAFIAEGPNGQPVRWQPCRPVRVAANYTGAAAGAEPLVRKAVARIAAATGMEWTYVGITSARAVDEKNSDRSAIQTPDAEIVVSWPATWNSGAAGTGGSSWQWSSATGEAWFTYGGVQMNSRQEYSDDMLLHILMHELGHTAGLQHPDDLFQVMSATSRTGYPDYRSGDRTGLAAIGRGDATC